MPDPIPTTYIVRRLTPDDAAALPELTLRVNGPDYVHAELYHPERIIRLNRRGELVSIVALDEKNELVGHYALERPRLDLVAESGDAMVLPEHQHQHLLDRMRTVLEEEARREAIIGIYGNTVTHHIFSQKTEEHFGAQPIALLLAASPADAHRDSVNLGQRVTLLSYFKFISPPGETVAHVPRRHRAIVDRIYQRTGRALLVEDSRSIAGAEGAFESAYDARTHRATIRVTAIGENSLAQILAERRRRLEESGAQIVYLSLPLRDAAAEALCEQAERNGFFFSGIDLRPTAEGDRLRLQFLPSPIDFGLIQIDGQPGRDLLQYIAAEYARTDIG
jgi:hypothetical protein